MRRSVLLVHATDAWYGSDRALLSLAIELRARGLEPTVAMALVDPQSPPGPLRRRLEDSGFEVLVAPGGLLDRAALRTPGSTAVSGARAMVRLAREARRRGSILVANTSLCAHLVVPARALGVPTVVWFREVPPMWWARLVNRQIHARAATLGVAIGREVLERSVPPSRRRRSLVVTDAVHAADPARAVTPEDAPRARIVVVGRLNPLREPHLALDVLDRLVSEGLDVELHFVGDADAGVHDAYVAGLRAGAARGRLAGRVVFRGFLEDPAPVIAGASVVLNPRAAEPLGHVMFEAFAHGTPFVGCAAGGPAEHVRSGANGLLVEPGSAPAMAAAVGRLLRDGAEARRLAAGGRAALASTRARVAAEHDRLVELLETL